MPGRQEAKKDRRRRGIPSETKVKSPHLFIGRSASMTQIPAQFKK